ncbi:MAG: hypothetical protein EPN82_00105 [Bacteroidetes bacterium]|nr:MAG: hypothetical protein EPN82_00105 [Bacteroidota bacterium]
MKLRYRKSIEIYFVLYLAALIFLLPSPEDDKKKADENNSKVFQIPFSIQPEKTTLNCRLILDSSGIKIMSIDSMNTVIYFGDVEKVDFEFTIEDPMLRQKLFLKNEADTSNPYFRFVDNKESQSAVFFWSPPIFERANKTYNVIVTAYATLKDESIEKSELYQTNRIIKAQTKFSLNMIYMNADLVASNQANSQNQNGTNTGFTSQNQVFSGFQPSGEIEIKPEQGYIKSFAYNKWTNTVNIYGGIIGKDLINPRIKTLPDKEDNGGTASILKIEQNRIIIGGTTPGYGKLRVLFTAISKFDKKEHSVDFIVLTEKYQEPLFERTMYPEKTYTIDPRIPLLLGNEIKALIRDEKTVRVQSEQGSQFQFTPDINDTNQIFTLECYVDGNLIGQKHQIRVLSYPNPVIKDVQYIRKGEVNILTNSYGLYNGKDNLAEIEVEGNAIVRELRGRMPDKPDNITNVQIFKCTPRNLSQPFSFRMYVMDSRGKKSAPRNFEE